MTPQTVCAAISLVCLLGLTTVSAIFTTEDCGVTKNCMRLPVDCSPSSPTCVFFSWIWDSTANNFQFELSGGAGGGTEYAAVAFGTVNDMQDADTYYCTGANLVSAEITTRRSAPTDSADNSGIAVTSASTGDGVGQCDFTRDPSVTKPTTAGNSAYDLTSGTFYVLLARGPITGGAIRHHSSRLISSRMSLTASPTVAVTTPSSSTTTSGSGDLVTATGCETSKGCFRLPDGCSPTDPGCLFFSWLWNPETNLFEMELSGGGGNGANYAAVGFSLVNTMQDADLYFCTGSALGTGSLTSQHSQPTQVPLNTVSGVTATSSGTNGGVAQCKFTRVASVTKEISSGNALFDLTQRNYFVLAARGAVSDAGILQYHDSNRGPSANAVNFTSFTGAGSAGVNVLVKAHGALMVLAWLFLANVGIMMARHFKPLYPDTQPGGIKLWFQMHRLIMSTVFVSTAIGFIIIFVHVGGFVSSSSQNHGIIGIVVMGLAVLNPVMAIFRPHPNTPRRIYFNVAHHTVGISARSLGIANLFLGVNTADVESAMPNWTFILGGFVGFLVLVEIIMEIFSWRYGHISNSCGKKDDPPKTSPGTLEVSETNVRVRGQGVKTFLLVFYAVGLAGFSIAFWAVIGGA